MDHGPLSLWPQASSLGSSLGALELKIHHCIPSLQTVLGFPGGAIGKEPACQCSEIRDMGLIPGLGYPLEEGMATYSSILAWRIPWMEEPGRLQSIRPHRVKHSWSDLACMYIDCLILFSIIFSLQLVYTLCQVRDSNALLVLSQVLTTWWVFKTHGLTECQTMSPTAKKQVTT